MKESKKDDFDVFGLHQPRLPINLMRDLLVNVRSANETTPVEKVNLTHPSLISDEWIGSCLSLEAFEALFAPLLIDVTPILKLRPVPRRTRLVLLHCHFLPYLALAISPLILATQLFSAM